MRQRGDQPDGAVAAHAQIAGVIEEDHPCAGVGVHWCAQQRTYQHIAAARLQHAGGPPGIVPFGQQLPALGHGARAEIRETLDHQTRGLTPGMRVDHFNAVHRATCRVGSVNLRVAQMKPSGLSDLAHADDEFGTVVDFIGRFAKRIQRALGRCSKRVWQTPAMCSSSRRTARSTSPSRHAWRISRCSWSARSLPADKLICMRR